MTNIIISTLILAVALLVLAAFELKYQRDFYKDCVEVLRDNPNHPVCGEK